MTSGIIKILLWFETYRKFEATILISKNLVHSLLSETVVNDSKPQLEFELIQTQSLIQTVCRLKNKSIDVVVVNLPLRNDEDLEIASCVRLLAPSVASVVVIDMQNEVTRLQAVSIGEENYLFIRKTTLSY